MNADLRPTFRDANKRFDRQLNALVHKMQRVLPALQIGEYEPLLPAEGKPYTGRTQTELRCGPEAATLYVLLFAPGDGTGNASSYTSNTINVPEPLTAVGERIYPRKKTGGAEIMMPIDAFHVGKPTKHVLNMFQLEEYTINGTDLQKLCVHDAACTHAFKDQAGSLTYGHLRDGRRFGDPHSIYYNPASEIGQSGAIQVAGFLELPAFSRMLPLIEALGTSPAMSYQEPNAEMISLLGFLSAAQLTPTRR